MSCLFKKSYLNLIKTAKKNYTKKTKDDVVNKIHKHNINTITMVSSI
jgi:hypothetical protein